MIHQASAILVALFLFATLTGCGSEGDKQEKKTGEDPKSPVATEPAETGPVIEVLGHGLENVKTGQTVKIKGCCGILRNGNVSVHIAKTYAGYRPPIAAPDLIKEFTKDSKAAEKKYGAGAIVVQGVVRERSGQTIILSGTKAPQPDKESAPSRLESPLTKASPDFSLTADELAAELKDPKSYDQKYGGKVIDLSGTVRRFNQDYGGSASVILEAKDSLIGVQCATVDDEPWAQVSPGQKIKLRGVCPKQALEAGLNECIVVEKEKSPILVVEAAKLAKEFATDLEEARKSYNDKYVIVTGEVLSNKMEQPREFTLTLKGDGAVSVSCLFGGPENAEVVVVPEGRRVNVLGQCSLDGKTPRFKWCHIIFEAP